MAHYIIHSVDYLSTAELGLQAARTYANSINSTPWDYVVYAYLQQAKDQSAQTLVKELTAISRLDENQFAAAYGFAAVPALGPGARSVLSKPWCIAKTVGVARAGDAASARRSAEEISTIRRGRFIVARKFLGFALDEATPDRRCSAGW